MQEKSRKSAQKEKVIPDVTTQSDRNFKQKREVSILSWNCYHICIWQIENGMTWYASLSLSILYLSILLCIFWCKICLLLYMRKEGLKNSSETASNSVLLVNERRSWKERRRSSLWMHEDAFTFTRRSYRMYDRAGVGAGKTAKIQEKLSLLPLSCL